MIVLEDLLRQVVARGGSDIHLKAGCRPILRLNTGLVDMDGPVLSEADVEQIARSLVSEKQWEIFRKRGDMDVAYLSDGIGRFRANIFRQRGMVGIVMRYVRTRIPNFKELGLPVVLERIALAERGIIIVSGATGCGKSTTLASMIDFINRNVRRHVVAIEDPIEYIHTDNKSVIDQREVGMDTRTFDAALRYVMREDPDIIMVGEMRDRESFAAVLAAADVGRMVMTTLHSPDAAQAMLRVMDFVPAGERDQVRVQLAANLVAVICQRLLPRTDGKGMIPTVEIMLGSPTVRKFIRENKIEKLADAIQDGRDEGMQTFNQSLVELVKASVVTEQAAMDHSPNRESLKMNLQGIYLDESRKILG
ncbi:MAG: PilT/PilU family type 4a pilus ATPase [bacterium]